MCTKHLLLGLGLAVGCPGAWALDSGPKVTVGMAPSYSNGQYGLDTQTKIVYLPLYTKVQWNNLDLKLTIPYLSVTGTNSFLSGGTVLNPAGKVKAVTATTSTVATKESGLGDIWLEARYRIQGSGAIPDFIPYAKVKFGTASYDKGLGTGENDYEAGLGAEWAVGKNLFPFLEAGYRGLGSPPGVVLENIATGTLGVMVQASAHHFLTGLYTRQQAAQPEIADAVDVVVAWNYRSNSGFGFQLFLDKGLSDSSPDYLAGIGVEQRF